MKESARRRQPITMPWLVCLLLAMTAMVSGQEAERGRANPDVQKRNDAVERRPQAENDRPGTAGEGNGENVVDFFLGKLNPGEINYGALTEQKRGDLLNATIFHRTHRTIFLLAAALFVSLFIIWRLRVTEREKLWMAAEQMSDFANENIYLRGVVQDQAAELGKAMKQIDLYMPAAESAAQAQAPPKSETGGHGHANIAAQASEGFFNAEEVSRLKLEKESLAVRVKLLEEENGKAKASLATAQAELKKKNTDLKEQLTRMDELEKRVRELKETQGAKKNLLSEHLQRIESLEGELRKRDLAIAEHAQTIRTLEQQKETADKSITYLTNKNKMLAEELESVRAQLSQ